MNVIPIRSDKVYEKMMKQTAKNKKEIYRHELMMPFEKMWALYNVPMKAKTENGYDVIMASDMLGYLNPEHVNEACREDIIEISSESLWLSCAEAIKNSLALFDESGIELPVKDYLFTIILANPDNATIRLSKGYVGHGGIPGYLFGCLTPNNYTLRRLPALFAHEVNHNTRFQFIEWKNDITLGEMIVSEGLAENFVAKMYGEDFLGPWITEMDIELLEYVMTVIFDNLHVQGLDQLNSFLYGDDIVELQGGQPVGLPYCAGYVCGFYLIKYFLNKTGNSIVNATLLPADIILKEVECFWELAVEEIIYF